MIVCATAATPGARRRGGAAAHDSFDALQFELGVGLCCGKCVAATCEVLCEARMAAGADKTIAVHRRTVETRTESRETALA